MNLKITKLFVLLSLLSSAAKAQIASIPFEMVGRTMYIKVKINNSDSLRFQFDTGGTGVLLDSLTAEQAGVSKTGRIATEAGGQGGSVSAFYIKHQEISLPGNTKLKNIEFTLMNLGDPKTGTSSAIAGIMGADLMNKYVTQIDFPNKRLLLYKRINDVDLRGFTPIKFDFYEDLNIPRFPVSIRLPNDEVVTGKVIFDSGAATTMLIFAPFSNYYSIKSKLGDVKSFAGRGLTANTTDIIAQIKGLDFDGFSFGPMNISVNVDDNAPKSPEYLGLLGIEVIRNFQVIMDYKHKVIYLKKIS